MENLNLHEYISASILNLELLMNNAFGLEFYRAAKKVGNYLSAEMVGQTRTLSISPESWLISLRCRICLSL
jgi:hypothetical protein